MLFEQIYRVCNVTESHYTDPQSITAPCVSVMDSPCCFSSHPDVQLSPSGAIWPPDGVRSYFSSVQVGFGVTAPQQSKNPSEDLFTGIIVLAVRLQVRVWL